MLDEILTLFPTSHAILVSLIASSFPHRRQSSAALQHYFKNLLHIAAKFIAVRPHIYTSCINLLLLLDVEIRADEDDENIINASQPLSRRRAQVCSMK